MQIFFRVDIDSAKYTHSTSNIPLFVQLYYRGKRDKVLRNMYKMRKELSSEPNAVNVLSSVELLISKQALHASRNYQPLKILFTTGESPITKRFVSPDTML